MVEEEGGEGGDLGEKTGCVLLAFTLLPSFAAAGLGGG